MSNDYYNLMQEPEILPYDRVKGQILDTGNYITDIFAAVGIASTVQHKDGTYNTELAIRIANELCAYVRLVGQGKIKIRQLKEPNMVMKLIKYIKRMFTKPEPVQLATPKSPIVAVRKANGGKKRGVKRTNSRRTRK